MRFVTLLMATLLLGGCSLFQKSEPIDVEIAQQLVENAEMIQSHTTHATDVLDGTTENDWDKAESLSLKMLLDANVALAKEALENAKKKNTDD